MASLRKTHAQYYSDMPFDEFARRAHAKYYSDMPFDVFMKKAGGNGAVEKGNWGELSKRLDAAESAARDVGPVSPDVASAVRQKAAREEGVRYGEENAAKDTGDMVGEGVTRAVDKFALGLPTLAEAYAPSWAGGQSSIPGAEAHEFLKAAQDGRANVNSKTAIAGNLGGALGQALLLPVASGPSLAARLGASGAQAAGIGAAESAIESRGDLGETARGAGYGFVGGALGQGIGDAAIRAGRAVIDPLRGLAKSGPVADQVAARLALEAKNAKLNPQSIAANLERLGPDAFIGDALGVQGATMARSAANLSPEARSILESASNARIGGQVARLSDDIARATGNPAGRTVEQLSESLNKASRPAINRAYETARDAGFDMPYSPFAHLMNSPKIQSAIKQAASETADRAVAYGGNQASQLAVYDAAKKILDRQGWKEGDDIAKALARQLRETVDANVPEYAGARALAQTAQKMREGWEIGADAARRNQGRDVAAEIKAAIDRGVPQERIAQGWGSQRADMLANKGPSEVNLKLSPSEDAAMRAAVGTKAADIENALARERDFMKFHKEVTGNSSTARQLAQQMAGAGLVGGGLGWATGFDPFTSSITGAGLAIGRRGLQTVVEAAHGKNERAVAEHLANALIGQSMPTITKTETARRALAEALLRDSSRAGGLYFAQ